MNAPRWGGIAIGGACILLGAWLWASATGWATAAIGVGAALMLASALSLLRRGDEDDDLSEPQRIEDLTEARRNELIRGTSMHLRNMKYRYSIRYDRSDRPPFTTEVNTILLGFVPVVILDNHSDKQGYGYVAFPFDGERWRGPGLPCGGDPEQAIEHAARCVSPLEGDEA